MATGKAAGAAVRHLILGFDAYVRLRHPTPYVVELSRDDRRLLLFGGPHTTDPTHPVFAQIEAAFARLAPSLALHEGTPPAVEPRREIAIRRHGESGLVRHLAARAGVETASMDIELEDEARLLRRRLPLAEALVFLVVRQLASYNRKTARPDFTGYFADFFARIAPGLGLTAIDWPMIESAHQRLCGRPLVVERVTALDTDPTRREQLTQRIATFSNRLRDEHMLDALLAALEVQPRVFATVGVSHAVMLEPALRAGLA
ncbi:MAG: hypothetical protein SF182_24070 [Deltaproteobacteria bacterium]|nr:hypothetical protein [Deltaproteobacteria bacterium]